MLRQAAVELFQQPLGLLERQGSSWVLTEREAGGAPPRHAGVGATGKNGRPGWPAKPRHRSRSPWRRAAGARSTSYRRHWRRFQGQRPVQGHAVRVCRARERIFGVRDGVFDLAIVSHEREPSVRCSFGYPLPIEDLEYEPRVAAAGHACGTRAAGRACGEEGRSFGDAIRV